MGVKDDRGQPGESADQTSIHVRMAVDGDSESLEWVVAHFSPLLEAQIRFRLGRRSSLDQFVADIVAETWLVTLSRMGGLVSREGRLAPVLMRFLGTTAQNICNNCLRDNIRRQARGEGPAAQNDDSAPRVDRLADKTLGVVSKASRRDVSRHIARCLADLSDERRDVLVLRLVEQLSNKEIAETLGIPPNTVAVRYRRALDELKARLPPAVHDEIAHLNEA